MITKTLSHNIFFQLTFRFLSGFCFQLPFRFLSGFFQVSVFSLLSATYTNACSITEKLSYKARVSDRTNVLVGSGSTETQISSKLFKNLTEKLKFTSTKKPAPKFNGAGAERIAYNY